MALIVLVWVTAAAMPTQGSSTRDVSAIELVNDPHPRDFVRISEGQPYVVPLGKILVVTGLGTSTNPTNLTYLRVDGADELTAMYVFTSGSGSGLNMVLSVQEISSGGMALQAGQTVTVYTPSGGTNGRAWGHLVDA